MTGIQSKMPRIFRGFAVCASASRYCNACCKLMEEQQVGGFIEAVVRKTGELESGSIGSKRGLDCFRFQTLEEDSIERQRNRWVERFMVTYFEDVRALELRPFELCVELSKARTVHAA